MTIKQAQEARIEAALNKRFNFDGEIMTIKDYLESRQLTGKSVTIRNHETKRRDLEYKPCKETREYSIWYAENGRDVGIDVCKFVYDFFTLPEKTTDSRY